MYATFVSYRHDDGIGEHGTLKDRLGKRVKILYRRSCLVFRILGGLSQKGNL
jgi:hypothetical protein